MTQRAVSAEAFREAVAESFGFLTAEAGFSDAEETVDGLAFRSPELEVEVWYVSGHEPEVATLVKRGGSDPAAHQRAWLGCLYVAAGCGPAQDVPGTAPTSRTVLKRAVQHATALRRLLPLLAGPGVEELFIRCAARRDLPLP